MGPTGWAVVAAASTLMIGVLSLWLCRAIEAGTLRRNYVVGIRTARSMRDDTSWQIAHDASVPAFRWAIVLAVVTATVVLVVRHPTVSAFAPAVPVILWIIGGLQGQAAVRRHQQE